MRRTALLIAVATATATACATAPSPGAEQKPTIAASSKPANTNSTKVTYYKGTVAVTSPDGTTPYGPPKPGLVKREVVPGQGRIVETTLDDGAMRVTTLTQTDGPVFAATDADGSFTGTVTFSPDPWKPTSWTYDLTMTDGSGSLTGTATLDARGLKTEKYFVTASGEQQARIVDDLIPTSEDEFTASKP